MRKHLLVRPAVDDVELRRWEIDAGRQRLARGSGLDARNLLEAGDRSPLASDDGVETLGPRGAHAECLNATRIETRRRGLEPREAADQQTRADEKDDGQRDLRGDEDPRHQMPSAGLAAATAAERVRRICARDLEGRRDREQDRCEKTES